MAFVAAMTSEILVVANTTGNILTVHAVCLRTAAALWSHQLAVRPLHEMREHDGSIYVVTSTAVYQLDLATGNCSPVERRHRSRRTGLNSRHKYANFITTNDSNTNRTTIFPTT